MDTDFYDHLLAEDYGYRAVGTKILICGGNDYKTTQAVTDFSYQVIALNKNKLNGAFYTSELDCYYKGAYKVETLSINGASFKDYTVVTPAKRTAYEAEMAARLVEAVKRLTGYTLSVKSDGKAYDGGYEILIGKTNREGVYAGDDPAPLSGRITAKDKLIALYGTDASGNAEAVGKFIEILEAEAEKGKSVAVNVTAPIDVAPDKSFSVMSNNVAVWDITPTRKKRVITSILYYLPDIIGFQEVSFTWDGYLKDQLSRYYGDVGESNKTVMSGHQEQKSSIYYNKERFELLDSGTEWFSGTVGAPEEGAQYVRIFTWAKFKDRVSGETFLFVNTHLDTEGSGKVRQSEVSKLIDFLREYTDIPVFLTGDMNCGVNSAPIQTLLKTSLDSVFHMTDQTHLQPNIDWIMAVENGVTVHMARVCDERVNGFYTSDHYPVYAELEIDLPEGGIENNWDEVYPISPEGYLQPGYDKEGGAFDPIISFEGFLKNGDDESTDSEGGGTQEPEGGGTQEPEDETLETPEDTEGLEHNPILPF